jgi:hypothetical protein
MFKNKYYLKKTVSFLIITKIWLVLNKIENLKFIK